MSSSPSPVAHARHAAGLLRAAGDPAVAAQSRRFFKATEDVRFVGVRTPDVRRLEREAFQCVRAVWHLAEALDFADRMVRKREHECRVFGLLTLTRFHREFEPPLLADVESWLQAGHCDNWALVDALCPLVISRLVEAHPDLIPPVVGWAGALSLWQRRAAVVTFVPLARKGRHLGASYQVVEMLFGDGEDLIHKACGWLLREAGRTDAPRLVRFLRRHGRRMPRTTVRYAIERFGERERKKLLRETGGR